MSIFSVFIDMLGSASVWALIVFFNSTKCLAVFR